MTKRTRKSQSSSRSPKRKRIHISPQCGLCLETIDNELGLIRLPDCGDTFHNSCFLSWLQAGNPNCPVCKTSFVNDQVCSICIEPILNRQRVSRLNNCPHAFHTKCIKNWVKTGHRTCPECRALFSPSPAMIPPEAPPHVAPVSESPEEIIEIDSHCQLCNNLPGNRRITICTLCNNMFHYNCLNRYNYVEDYDTIFRCPVHNGLVAFTDDLQFGVSLTLSGTPVSPVSPDRDDFE